MISLRTSCPFLLLVLLDPPQNPFLEIPRWEMVMMKREFDDGGEEEGEENNV